MHILICNDDGYFADGIQLLHKALLGTSHKVSMVAPDRDNSACGMGITLRKPLTLRQLGEGAYTVSGTPVDCVGVAMGGLLAEPVDIVISGINNGSNLGDDVLYSGTVAAAVEARRLSLPNISLSITEQQPRYYETAIKVLFDLLEKIADFPLGNEVAFLNVNVPDLSVDELKGLKVTSLASRTSPVPPREEVTAKGVRQLWLGAAGGFDAEKHADGQLYDYQAIEQGYASVTPVKAHMIDQPYLQKTAEWLNS